MALTSRFIALTAGRWRSFTDTIFFTARRGLRLAPVRAKQLPCLSSLSKKLQASRRAHLLEHLELMTHTLSRRTFAAAATACGIFCMTPAMKLFAAPAQKTITVATLNERSLAASVDVPLNPQRIAVADMASLDILDHWGLTERIVAMTQTTPVPYLAKYFKKTPRVANIGTLKELDLEGLMASEPDIIFISGRLAKKYKELSRIAPVVYLSTDRSIGTLKSFEANLMNFAKIFNRSEDARRDIMGFSTRLAAIREAARGKTALVGLVTSAHVNLLGNAARCSLIGNEFGFVNVASEANANHGNESSFELLVKLDPDYFFVLDRDSAIARPGAKLAQDILNNDLVNRMKAKKEGRIAYLTPAAWYLAEGGVSAMDIMFSDVEKALGIAAASPARPS